MTRSIVAPALDEPALASVRRLLARYQAGLPHELRVHDLELELRTLEQRYPWPSAALFLARAGDADAGCVIANPLDATTLEIRRLYVEPEFRGTGTARALMEAAAAFARERSHRRLVLDTEPEILRPAYELYVKLGFAECARYAETTYANPIYMELPLL
jgi:GNAT superfamily N-acetyltransferase